VSNTPQAGYATTLFEAGTKKTFKGVYVHTFNGSGVSTPEFVNVAVICP
jgi:hypothetical protein